MQNGQAYKRMQQCVSHCVGSEVHVDSGYSTRLNIYVPFHLVFVSLDEREM